jgi:hypothetical protein
MEITIETREVLVSRQSTHPVTAWCPSCAREVSMDTPEGAARSAGVSIRTMYRWVEARKVHFAETLAGALLVCRESLGLQDTPKTETDTKTDSQ